MNNLHLTWTTEFSLKIFTVLTICFLSFRIFEQLALALKNRFYLKFLTVLKYFLSFRIFEQLALALKNRVALKFFTVLKYFLLFRIFEQLALVLKTEFVLKIFTGLKYFLSFRNFEQLALALKTEFALKFFKPGRQPPPLRTPMGLWYRAGVYNLFAIAGRITFIYMKYGANEFELYLWDTFLKNRFYPVFVIYLCLRVLQNVKHFNVLYEIMHRVDWFSCLGFVFFNKRQHGRQISYFKLHVDGRKFLYRRPHAAVRPQVVHRWYRGWKHYLFYCLENENFKTAWISLVSTEWIVLVWLKIRGYYYYKKGVYVQVIRSTPRRYFRERQHGPAWKSLCPKNKPPKNARNHGNLTKRTSQLHERAINSKKTSLCHLLFRRM